VKGKTSEISSGRKLDTVQLDIGQLIQFSWTWLWLHKVKTI